MEGGHRRRGRSVQEFDRRVGGQDLLRARDLSLPHPDRRGPPTQDWRGGVWGLKGLAVGVRGLLEGFGIEAAGWHLP